ncbi:MAG: hypothetical protein GX478_07835, partial [Erysipelotrichaceae bacterium]|nr:hypothetical protein [Erysipelotrichaceae bacterium]
AAYTGGLIGHVTGSEGSITIRNSYASGSVKDDKTYDRTNANLYGSKAAGGLIGIADYTIADINNCYSTASVMSKTNAGGIVGVQNVDITYNSCYNAGAVLLNDMTSGNAGSFIGSLGSGKTIGGTGNATLIGPNLKWYDTSWTEYDPNKETTDNPAGYSTDMAAVGNNKTTVYAGITDTYADDAPFKADPAAEITVSYHYDSTTNYPFASVTRTQPYGSNNTGTTDADKQKDLKNCHYGDWPTMDTGSIKVTKTVETDSSDTKDAVLASIKLTVKGQLDSADRTITVALNKMTADANGNYVYTYSMYLPAGTNYSIQETGRKPDGVSACVTKINDTPFDDDATEDPHLSFDVVKGKTATAIGITNTYVTGGTLKGTGFLYYEKTDGKYYYHGWLNDTEVSTQNVSGEHGLLHTSGVTASEAGYVLVIKNTWNPEYTYVNGFGDWQPQLDFIKASTLQDLIDDHSFIKKDSLKTSLGVESDYDVYTINTDTYASNYNSKIGDQRFSVSRGIMIWPFTERYSCGINPLFADEIYKDYGTNTTTFKIRTAQQLEWLSNSSYSNAYALNPNVTLQQTLDIDFGGTSTTIEQLNATYMSTSSTDSTPKLFTTSNLDRPFVKNLYGWNATAGTSTNGHIKNVDFEHITIAQNNGSAFVTNTGVWNNSDNSDAVLENVTVNHVNVTCDVSGNFGVVTKNTTATIKNLHVSDFNANGISASGHFGIIADNMSGIVDGLEVTDSWIGAALTNGGSYGGVVAASENGGLTSEIKNCTVSNVILSKSGGSERFAVVGYAEGTSMSNIQADHITSFGSGMVYSYAYSGKSVTIDNCNISSSTMTHNGFAYSVQGASSINQCNVTGSTIGEDGFIKTGTLIASITDCHVKQSSVGGTGFINSLTDKNNMTNTAEVSNCSVESCVSSNGANSIGGSGFIETASNLTSVKDCSVSGNQGIGGTGFIGTISGSTSITNCHVDSTTAAVNGQLAIGGAGFINTGSNLKDITECYVSGNQGIGGTGFINSISNSGTVSTCYVDALLSASDNAKGTIGGDGFIGTV